ncbi:MAG: transposase [Succinivibrio sp.]|nr:transposase [Succinivibrio sp.]
MSSKFIRSRQSPTITRALWGNALWSPSYFASSCGGAPISIQTVHRTAEYP